MIKISPSILAADFANLEQEIKILEEAGADMIHIDVMDGHFVPSLTFGSPVIKTIRQHTSLPFDVHLMIDRPEKSLQQYIKAGADMITIHPEATRDLQQTVEEIKKNGVKAGIAVMLGTDLDILDSVIDKIDLILVMSVKPGFGGQKFIDSQLDVISQMVQKVAGKQIDIAVDGGINDKTAPLCIKAGANILVAGSYIFKGDYKQRILELRGG